MALFGFALIILSSLAGADLIVEAFRPSPSLMLALLVGLAVVGIAMQRGIMAWRPQRTA
jgi:hypothetical protein